MSNGAATLMPRRMPASHCGHVCRLLGEFSDTTTMHGVRRAAGSPTINGRLCWSLLTVACVIGFLIQLTILLDQYKQYPVSVKRLSQSVAFHFPDLTFCVAGSFLERPELPLTKLLLGLETNLDEFRLENVSRVPDLFKLVSRIRYSSMDESVYYLPLNDILVDCAIHGQPCNASMFSRHSSSRYRGCYTFHSDRMGESSSPKVDLLSYGMRLVLYTHNETRNATDSGRPTLVASSRSDGDLLDLVEGIKTIIHPHTTFPVPEFRGVTMASAKAYQFSVRMLETHSLSTPAKPCQEDLSAGLVRVRDRTSNELTEFAYDQEVCLMRSYQAFLYAQCGCVSYVYPVFEQYSLRDQCHYLSGDWLAYLASTFYVNWNATARAVVNRLADRSLCHDRYFNSPEAAATTSEMIGCAHPCIRQSYSNVVSMAKWPTAAAYPVLVSRLNSMFDAAMLSRRFTVLDEFALNRSLPMNELQQRVTKIDVLAESYLADLEEEELSYTIEKLLSDLGGNLGLWVGVSVLTVLEVLDLLLSYIRLVIRQRWRRVKGARCASVGPANLHPAAMLELSIENYRLRRTSVYPSCYLGTESAWNDSAVATVAGACENESSEQSEMHYF